jgi:hypothetical protein
LRLGVRQSSNTLVCGRFDGAPKSPVALTQEFMRFAGRMKDMPRVRFHDLRHNSESRIIPSAGREGAGFGRFSANQSA